MKRRSTIAHRSHSSVGSASQAAFQSDDLKHPFAIPDTDPRRDTPGAALLCLSPRLSIDVQPFELFIHEHASLRSPAKPRVHGPGPAVCDSLLFREPRVTDYAPS